MFVSEECRGNGVSEKLICFANEYVKAIGFNRTFVNFNKANLKLSDIAL